MTFLNSMLLAGGAAFLIPLIIHLLNRRKVNQVRWGPMHLLAEVLKQKKRRLQIEQWLLLFTRILIPILLALCLARPVLSAMRALPGFGKTSMVIVLDDSFSMRAAGSTGAAWDRAKAALTRVMEGLPRGSDVQVVLAGGQPRTLLPQSTSALDLVGKALDEVPALSGPVNPEEALKAAAAILTKASNGARELVVVSDFQGSDWRAVSEGGVLTALDELQKVQPKPALSFFRLENDAVENLALAAVEMSAVVAAEGQPVGLRVRVQNHGKRLWQDVALHLEADGARLRTTRITVPGEGETTVSFTHAFDKQGDHTLGVRLEGDSLAEDNAWTGVVKVRAQVNVLLIDGEPSEVPLRGSADFVELALAPHLAAASGMKDLVSTTKVEYRRVRDTDFKGKEVVVLTDVERLNRTSDLEKFVQAGGGLLIFAGRTVDVKRYNSELWRGGKGLLPVEIGGMGHAETPGSGAKVLTQRLTHSALSYFNDPRAGRLADGEFRSWWKLDAAGEGVKPMLLLDSGDALMLEKPFGKGKVILVGSTATPVWNNLPLQTVWVPLIQRVVSYLATQGTGSNASVIGQSVRFGLDSGTGEELYAFTKPDGKTEELKARKETQGVTVESSPILTPGVYEAKPSSGGGEVKKFAFNVDATESGLKPLAESEVTALAARWEADVVEDVDSYQRLDRSRRFGAELWQIVLLLLLVFLFAEVLLEQRIAKA